MDELPPVDEELPSYNEAASQPRPQSLPPARSSARPISTSSVVSVPGTKPVQGSDNILQPTTLYVAGRFIHSSDPSAPPLYEFSHSIGFLRETDHTVRLERLDPVVKHQPQVPGEAATIPVVTTKNKHIYNLRHPTLMEGGDFQYYGESTSRTSRSFGMGAFRVKRFRPARGYQVFKALRTAQKTVSAVSEQVLFTALPARDKTSDVAYEWSNAQGEIVAREVEQGDLMSLVITAALQESARDMLVGSWIERVWWELARGNLRTKNWQDVRRALRKHEEPIWPSGIPDLNF